MKLGNSVLDVR